MSQETGSGHDGLWMSPSLILSACANFRQTESWYFSPISTSTLAQPGANMAARPDRNYLRYRWLELSRALSESDNQQHERLWRLLDLLAKDSNAMARNFPNLELSETQVRVLRELRCRVSQLSTFEEIESSARLPLDKPPVSIFQAVLILAQLRQALWRYRELFKPA